MTIEEIIAKETEIAEEFQRTVDTHMVNYNLSLEQMYCDDTEVVEEELKKCKELSEYHSTVANIMRKYHKIEQILKETHEGCITKYQKIEEVIKRWE